MGSWDCYCALCGCPIASHQVILGSLNRYALAARRNRVARKKRRLAGGKNLHEDDEESLIEIKRLGEALKHEEPGQSLDQLEWESGYDPEIVEEKFVEWLAECRCLGINRQSEGGGK
jgi:hypothetical protein